ncbi:NAD(P)/FAD-dependent oxidoreductase [Geothrix sp. PMB-07]|uniref:protoporphyrinogen/coproporphyrinogen oxidase n=1 Tax=Geothrix sp. PMB-07 TaxID=3068640 RepID=UPI0027424B84|nr:FAD-dependent oxidoreductase [Geothrix sp. PMB-07]WLT32374.1 FAD-dependent oxidoreductase [Geothrix sp. PMB-07]
MGPRRRILIIGGGLSGLLAAWHLQRRGLEVALWEASAAVGGWAQTLSWPGPEGEPGGLEQGPQGLLIRQGGALDRLARELSLSFLPSAPKGPRWLGKGGRRQLSPVTLAGLLHSRDLNLAAKLRLFAEPFIAKGDTADETLQDFFARRLGEGFARELLPALVAGVLAASPERIAVAALPRLRRLEAHGGLLLGALRLGPEHTQRPVGGTGSLAQALAASVGDVQTNQAVRALEALPDGRWRIVGEASSREADAVVLALPAPVAGGLLRDLAPRAAAWLEGIPQLNLQVWHSRHRLVPGWERGFSLLLHPPEGRGLLGVVSLAADDPRGVPGLLQLRTYLGGAFPVAPDLNHWPGVFAELRRWLPELPEPLQTRREDCPGAFPLLEPGHVQRVRQVVADLPPNLHWLGASRFGPGVPDLAEGIEDWALTLS